MNSITEQLEAEYSPVMAVIVYEHGRSNYYLESHEIVNGQMMAGKPFSEDTLSDVIEFFSNKQSLTERLKGEIPETLLYCEWNNIDKTLVWYNKPTKRVMHFTSNLHIPSGEAYQPGLIYHVHNNEMSVYAIKSKSKPNPKDKLYTPPYHNCNINGLVCTGNARVKMPAKLTYQNMMTYYETIFWASEFSHLVDSNSNMKGNVNSYWKNAIKTGCDFNNDVLKPIDKDFNLSQLLKELSK